MFSFVDLAEKGRENKGPSSLMRSQVERGKKKGKEAAPRLSYSFQLEGKNRGKAGVGYMDPHRGTRKKGKEECDGCQ